MAERFLINSNQERSMDNFWLLNPDSVKRKKELGDELGSCLRTLRRCRALRWGKRKKVRYLSRHPEFPLHLPSMEEEGRKNEGSEKSLREEKEESEREVEEQLNMRRKKTRREKKEGPCRWSAARCEYAKKSLLEVMRKMGATWDKPVLRRDLRVEARKLIGDLGLLDHMLKHMAGVVFAEGKERFVRRHNSEGAMEYFLEPAELAQMGRAEPGNSGPKCNCHCHCKKITSQLKEEVNLLKSEIDELKSLKETKKLAIVDPAWEEKYESLLAQHLKLEEQVAAISISLQAMKEDICSLKEEKENRRHDELAIDQSPHAMSFATSAPPQLMLLPSPNTPLPPPRPAIFYQAQSSAGYPSPGMENSRASQEMARDELVLAMAPPIEINSEESFDVARDLVLASLTY